MQYYKQYILLKCCILIFFFLLLLAFHHKSHAVPPKTVDTEHFPFLYRLLHSNNRIFVVVLYQYGTKINHFKSM